MCMKSMQCEYISLLSDNCCCFWTAVSMGTIVSKEPISFAFKNIHEFVHSIFFFLFACFNLRDRGERWGLNVGFVTNLCCYVDHDISFIVILKLYFSNLLVMYLGSYSRFNMSNPQADPLLQVETTCGSLLYELQVLCESF